MDAADGFLLRRERKALARRRRGEPLRAMAAVTRGGEQGLMAATPTRILHARRDGWRMRISQWSRREVASIGFEAVRHGAMVVHLRTGKRLRFDFASRQDAASFQGVVTPPTRRATPAAGAGPVQVVLRSPSAAPDPLAHRGTPAHVARLRDLHARGLLTKAELEWQLAA